MPLVATMDTDGQHTIEDLRRLLHWRHLHNSPMVIGQRTPQWTPRGTATRLLNLAASILAGQEVPDFGSGLRVFDTAIAKELVLPDGFDFNAALTMGFLAAGHQVQWLPITVQQRQWGHSFVQVADGFITLRTLWQTRPRST